MSPRLLFVLVSPALALLVGSAMQAQVRLSEAYVEERRGQFQFEVPEVYELASIISFLANDSELPELMAEEGPYVEAVRAHFGPFRDHPAVGAARFDADGLMRYVLFRDNAYRFCFRDYRAITECRPVGALWNSVDLFGPNAALVADFAADTDFREFYHQHRSYYARLVDAWRASVELPEVQDWLEREFTMRLDALDVVFSPLTTGTHSTARFHDPEQNFWQAAMFLAPVEEAAADPLARFQVAVQLFTEIDHNYVNPASDRYRERIAVVLDPAAWASQEALRYYDSPYEVFNEYMTYGVFLLWAREQYDADTFGRGRALVVQRMEGRRGFTRFGAFQQALFALYELRPPGATVESLYPAVLDWVQNAEF